MWIDNEEQDKNQGIINSSTPSIGTGGGGVQASGIAGNPSTITPVQSNQPTQQFATVQDYLGANKTQGEDLGNKLTNKLGESATQEKSTISGAANKALEDVNAGKTNYDASLVSKALTDPTKVANSPDQLSSFLNQWNAAYKGPESFESTTGYTDAAKAANEATQKQAQIKSAGGQQQLLQDEFNVYGQGNKGLDQALLQNSSAFPKVQQQAKEFGTIGDYLKSNAASVGTTAQAAKAATEAAKKQTQDAFANSFSDFQKNLNTNVASTKQNAANRVDTIKADLASGDVNKITADLNKSNLSPSDRKNIQEYLSALNQEYGVNPQLTNYYNYNPELAINPSTVANINDYQKSAALQKLTGVDYSGVLNPANINKGGSWDTINKSYDSPGLQSYLKGTLGQHDKELMAKSTTDDAADKLNLTDALKDTADVDNWTKFAKSIIDTARRSGTKAGFGQTGVGYETNPLGKLVMDVRKRATNAANANGGNLNNPKLVGISTAEKLLEQYFNQPGNYTLS